MRLRHVIRKEFIQFSKDRRMIPIVFIAPVLQLLVLGHAARHLQRAAHRGAGLSVVVEDYASLHGLAAAYLGRQVDAFHSHFGARGQLDRDHIDGDRLIGQHSPN